MTTMTTIELKFAHCPSAFFCGDFHQKWGDWCWTRQHQELALCLVTDKYRKSVLDDKSRNMVKKSGQHFNYFKFNHNSYLDDMFEINTSKPVRQGKRMSPGYLEKPQPIILSHKLCRTVHNEIWLGAFDSKDKLRAYSHLAIIGELAIINRIIGHGDYLKFGVMNGLVDRMVSLLDEESNAKWINYLDLINCGEGLRRFKKSVGFQTHKVNFEY